MIFELSLKFIFVYINYFELVKPIDVYIFVLLRCISSIYYFNVNTQILVIVKCFYKGIMSISSSKSDIIVSSYK
jgi:hypothetical protein